MRTIIIFIFLSIAILIPINIAAQERVYQLDTKVTPLIDKALFECVYQYTAVIPIDQSIALSEEDTKKQDLKIVKKNSVEEYQTILQANTKLSKFWDYNSYQKDSVQFTSEKKLSLDDIDGLELRYERTKRYLFTSEIFKNYPPNLITVFDEIPVNDYSYEEPLSKLNWELSDDTLTVCSYLCYKATTLFGGRKWTVWYAPDIAISDGPWKLRGLPGLILKAQDQFGIHSFEATVIRNSNSPIYFSKDSGRIKTNKTTFIKEKKKMDTAMNRDELIQSRISKSQTLLVEYSKNGVIYYNGKRVNPRSITIYEPLELE